MRYLMHLSEDEFASLLNRIIEDKFKLEGNRHPEQPPVDLMKIEQVASLFEVSERTIRNWVKQKKIKCHWIGGRQYFFRSEVLACLS